MLFLIEIDSLIIEAATPEEAEGKAIWLFRNDSESAHLTVVPHDSDEHGPVLQDEIWTAAKVGTQDHSTTNP